MYKDHLIQFQPVSWSVDDSQLAKMIQAFQKVYENVKSLRTNCSRIDSTNPSVSGALATERTGIRAEVLRLSPTHLGA